MIKVNRIDVEYEGTKSELLAEISMLINDMFDSGKFTKEEFELAVEKGCTPRKELFKEAMENIDELLALLAARATLFDDKDAKEFLDKLLEGKNKNE
jgi:hypothetical protein